MNIKKIIAVGVAGMAISAMALDKVEVTEVKARQRYPWNGLVDIDFKTDSKPTEPYQMQVVAFDNVGKTNLPVRSVYTEGVSFEGNACMVKMDTSRIVWDASKDLPNGFKATNVLVSCQDVRAMGITNLYMIVDISGGTSAETFPVSYTNAPPPGGWTEEHMTTKLVLRRVEPGSFMMGSYWLEDGHQANETQHKVTLTKPYYIAIYELTAKQFALIYGGTGSDTQPTKQRMSVIRGRDFDNSYTTTKQTATIKTEAAGTSTTYIRYELTISQNDSKAYCWPESSDVAPSSLMGVLRKKSGIKFDLPTEAQWEYACRAGSKMPIYIGESNTSEMAALITGSAKLDPTETHYLYVGNYMPNALGLYDMSGGADEWCLDYYKSDLGTADVFDPNGGSPVVAKLSATTTSGTVTSGTTVKNNIPLTFDGTTWHSMTSGKSVSSEVANVFLHNRWQVTKTFLSSIKRVVRGAGSRSACRTQDDTLERASKPICVNNSKVDDVASSDSVRHGVRIAFTVDE